MNKKKKKQSGVQGQKKIKHRSAGSSRGTKTIRNGNPPPNTDAALATKTGDNKNNDFEILKMEYEIYRKKIDQLEELLKDLRFKGISVVTGFTGAVGFLFNFEYWQVAFVLSILTMCLIILIWGYDLRFFNFQIASARNAVELEEKIAHKSREMNVRVMITYTITKIEHDLKPISAYTGAIMYSIFIGTLVILIILYSRIPFLILLITSGIFLGIMFKMWHLRFRAQDIIDDLNDKIEDIEINI